MNPAPIPPMSQNQASCPRCGVAGKPVKILTLQSLLKPTVLSRVASANYRFCPSENCEVVYFAGEAGEIFVKSDLKVRVGVKETTSPRHVCYCFNHTVEEIEEEVRLTGRTTVLDDIKTRMKKACWCETTSPQGSCCLSTVTKYVKAAVEKHGKPAIVLAETKEDCCASGGHVSTAAPGVASLQSKREEDCCASKSDVHSVPVSDKAPVTNWTQNASKVSLIGSVLAAVVASACCWLPLLLLAVGVSGAAVGAAFERYRPIFLGVTFAFLAAAFYFTYRPRPKFAVPETETDCCAPAATKRGSLQRFNRAMLWVVTAIVLAFAFFPSYVGPLLGNRSTLAMRDDYDKAFIAVEGMTCQGCATTLQKELATIPGVQAVEISYERKQAIVGVPKGGAVPREELLAAIASAGFKGRFESAETRTIPISGMTCEACAVHIQTSLAKVPGVLSAEVSYKEQKAIVRADASVNQTALEKAVELAGYKVASEVKTANEK